MRTDLHVVTTIVELTTYILGWYYVRLSNTVHVTVKVIHEQHMHQCKVSPIWKRYDIAEGKGFLSYSSTDIV